MPGMQPYDETIEDYFSKGSNNTECVIEQDRPPATFTGLLDHTGQPIYRVPPPRPPIGFHTPPEAAILFELDPEVDFIYSTDLDLAGGPDSEED